ASYMGFLVYQMDVKSAFLYGEIEEEVRGTIDKTLFIKKDTRDILLVQVYVDDIIFGSTNKAWCDEFEVLMKGEFEMSVMGEMTFFLGLQVKQLPDGIFISQDKYVKDMLTKFDMESVRTATTPYEAAKTKLKDETDPPVNVHLYRSMIGSLMYLTASRPDIMFAVSACSRHQVTPLTSHLNAVKKIFKYLKGQPKLGLWYPKDSPFQLEAYSDSDYAGSHGDRKSTTGGCQFLGRRLISWQCKKQTIVATSSTEAEYVAAASCCAQVLWIQNQLLDYGFNFMNTKIFIDNQSTICIVKNPVFHQRTKHIEIRHHFIRDANEKNLIQVLKIHTDDNVADLLTKAFDGPRFEYLVVHIGMVVNTAASCTFFLLSAMDYAGSHGDRKSTTGGCQFLGRRLISWQCKKQTIVATSSTEAEYVAAASCCAQVLWIQNQLLDYGFNFMNTKIFIDNQSTICIVKNPVFHQRTKHIEIRHHFIRDANEKNLIQVLKIHTDDNVADLLTKAFDGPRFEYLVVHIGMVDMVFCRILFSCDCRVCVPAVCMVSAVGCLFLLAAYIHAAGVVYAANTSTYAAELFDIAGWLVSATSHLVSAVLLSADLFRTVLADGLSTSGLKNRTTELPQMQIGLVTLVATIDGREVVVTESLIRAQLQLDDAMASLTMQIDEILGGMGLMGIRTDRTPYLFLSTNRSPQWRFLVHTIMHCLSLRLEVGISFPSSIADKALNLFIELVAVGSAAEQHQYPILHRFPLKMTHFLVDSMRNLPDGPDDAVLLPTDRCMLVMRTDSLIRKLSGNLKEKQGGEAILDTGGMWTIQDDVDFKDNHVWHLRALGVTIKQRFPPEDMEGPRGGRKKMLKPGNVRSKTEASQCWFKETDWLNLMMQVGSNPALARELLGADVTEENFVERMTAIKDKKKRALADLRYRALKGKPMKQSEVTQMMRTLVKNQRLEKDRLLSAQYNLFRPKPAISEPPSKRQRVARASSQPSNVPAATTQPADDHDSAGGSSFHPAGSAPPLSGSAAPTSAGGVFGVPDSTVSTSAAMDSAGSHRESGVSPFADSADSSSPSPVSTDHISIDGLLVYTSGGINDFFLDSDEDAQIGMSRVAADPDSEDDVLAEILFRGKYISGAGVVVVDKLPDDEIVDPRVKVETVSDYASSPPRSRRKHRGVRSDDFRWDKPVEDFFSSESESDDDLEHYIPPLPYGAFKDWEIVRCPLSTTYYHVYYQENRRQKSFFYLKQLLPHVYREDLLLLRRRMNRYFRLNPDVDVGLDLWRDVNLLCQSLHSDDVEDFWRTQDDWIVSSWKLYPKSSVHVLDLTNGKTVYMFIDRVYPIRATLLERMLSHKLTVPPSYCRDVVVAGSVIQTVQASLRESYECLASVPIACTARQMVFSSPWLTAKKESGSSLQTALVCNSNPLIAIYLVNWNSRQSNNLSLGEGCWELLIFLLMALSVVSRWHVSSSILLISLLVSHVLVSASTEIGIADYVSAGMFSFSADRDSNLLIVILDRDSQSITPDYLHLLSTEEPDNSLSMGDEHLGTISETESDKLIKSSVENLVPIPSESEGIFDNMCDMPFCDKNHFDAESDLMESLLNRDTSIVYSPKIDSLLEEFAGELAPINPIPPGIQEADFDPKEDIRLVDQLFYDDTSSDDDYFEHIDYVEASPPDSELVSLEEVNDDILREKLLNINHLIAKIKSLNDNPTPDRVLRFSSNNQDDLFVRNYGMDQSTFC
ncbi:putative ribonuclease H-like domain-containing protein, partial [Tanacetum coccineum]